MSSYSKKILRKLAEKSAVPIAEITTPAPLLTKEGRYAISRSLKNLIESGLVEKLHSGRENYLRITKKGKTRLDVMRLSGEDALMSRTWDGSWRIIILDLPEDRKSEREALRYLLKKANFTCIKNTVWVSPHPYEHLFQNIKKDLGLTTELMIIVTDKLDEETKKAFFQTFGK